jgi:O-antigen/teichoic acid export membrane protein
VLLVGALVSLNLSVAFNVAIGVGQISFWVRYSLIAAALNLALSVALVGSLQVLGVVLGTVVADAILFPFGLAHVLRSHKVSMREFFSSVVLPTYPFLLLTAGVAAGLGALGLAETLWGVAGVGLVSVVAGWAGVYLIGLDQGERHEISNLVGELLRRFTG